MIKKVNKIDPLICFQCEGAMKIIAFLTDYLSSIGSLAETYGGEPFVASQEFLMDSVAPADYLS